MGIFSRVNQTTTKNQIKIIQQLKQTNKQTENHQGYLHSKNNQNNLFNGKMSMERITKTEQKTFKFSGMIKQTNKQKLCRNIRLKCIFPPKKN